jgi:hypothetical protein
MTVLTNEEFEKKYGCSRSTVELMDLKSDEELAKITDFDTHGVTWEQQAKCYAARLVQIDRRYHKLRSEYDEYKKQHP